MYGEKQFAPGDAVLKSENKTIKKGEKFESFQKLHLQMKSVNIFGFFHLILFGTSF